MDYRLTVNRTWRFRDRRRGLQVLQPGEYSIPEDLSLDVAKLAVDQGMATIYRVQMPTKIESQISPTQTVRSSVLPPPPEPRKKRGPKRRKGPAPENKIVHAAENKSGLV